MSKPSTSRLQATILPHMFWECATPRYVNPKRYPNGQSGRVVPVVLATYEGYAAAARVQEDIDRGAQCLAGMVMEMRKPYDKAYRPHLHLSMVYDENGGWELRCTQVPTDEMLERGPEEAAAILAECLDEARNQVALKISPQDVRRATSAQCLAHGHNGTNLVGMSVSVHLGKLLDVISTVANVTIDCWVTHPGNGVLSWNTSFDRVQDRLEQRQLELTQEQALYKKQLEQRLGSIGLRSYDEFARLYEDAERLKKPFSVHFWDVRGKRCARTKVQSIIKDAQVCQEVTDSLDLISSAYRKLLAQEAQLFAA